jgi:hypothetical protein
MSFVEVLNTYFRGEKLEAWFFILPVGVLLVAFGAVALRAERGGFAWSIAIPCILAGLVFIGTGIGVGARTDGQVAELTRSYHSAPAEMVKAELPRMQKVNANFRTTFVVFGVLTAVGLILIFAIRSGWSQGLGSALILVSALGFMIDGFAGRRARPYTAALEALAAEHGTTTAESPP